MVKERIKKIIFTGNQIWNLMYFDDFINHDNYQITYLKDADRPYYNCAHVHETVTIGELKEIESYFKDRNLPSRIYTHTYSEPVFIELLQELGYKQLVEEEEVWYEYSLNAGFEQLNLAKYFKGDINDLKTKELDPHSADILDFMKLNSIRNDIPSKISEKFINNIRFNSTKCKIDNQFYAAYLKNSIATIGTMACIDNQSFLSEGATNKNFSRMGLYSMLVAHRINLSKQKNCNYVYIRCDKYAFSNQACLKVGFKLIFERFLWEKAYD